MAACLPGVLITEPVEAVVPEAFFQVLLRFLRRRTLSLSVAEEQGLPLQSVLTGHLVLRLGLLPQAVAAEVAETRVLQDVMEDLAVAAPEKQTQAG